MAGMVGNEWETEKLSPMMVIPKDVSLTAYSGEPDDLEHPIGRVGYAD
jgi:hypothetical protein